MHRIVPVLFLTSVKEVLFVLEEKLRSYGAGEFIRCSQVPLISYFGDFNGFKMVMLPN